MEIVKDDIKLRAIEKTDLSLLKSLINNSEIENKLGGWSFPVSEYEQEKWIQSIQEQSDKNCLRLIIEKDGEAVGTVILSDIDMKNGTAQIHIKMLCQKNKGYGTRCIKMVCNYAFAELRLNTIYSTVLENNIVSQKVFEKCGFSKEGLLRARVFKNSTYLNMFSYSILKSEWNYDEN
jgi:RimJ/RimL family protein N-acetyltransferase